ncbi:glycosyltransferase [Flexithrix dorotheae]|uniref:glycosyltransferase n=1 Tax=Flexithrix dorotheae TaxID=70993 RepID=UPI000361E033|nr:glycosyltransferase [Flexithrix dorotheae]
MDTSGFEFCAEKEDYFITASRMVPYKKIDLIVEAFNELPEKKLVVIGNGPDFEKIKAKAGSNIELMGFQKFEVLKEKIKKARAFVFAADEDFGIMPVEAQACGTPVIAYRKGGALETVVDNETGLFFEEQSVESLKNTVLKFDQGSNKFKPEDIRAHALKFDNKVFRESFEKFVIEAWKNK